MIIGLFGMTLNNENLGCLALTYSMLQILNEISEETGIEFQYILFEPNPSSKRNSETMQELGMSKVSIDSSRVAAVSIRGLLRINRRSEMTRNIRRCDAIIDMTGGDSFSDIYGNKRYLFWSRIKEYAQKLEIPLILGPQTIGPFLKHENQDLAKRIIRNAKLVMARDKLTAEYIEEVFDQIIEVTTDVAFILPRGCQDKAVNKSKEVINIGINISGLLTETKYENTPTQNIELAADYDMYIDRVIKALYDKENYIINLIPHVRSDVPSILKVKSKYPKCIVMEFVESPIKAKNYISHMDIMIGSRMHATIAAFSCGVATIPVAYSRKFAGVYGSLGYNKIIDLCAEGTGQAVEKTLLYIDRYKELEKEVSCCLDEAAHKVKRTKELLSRVLAGIGHAEQTKGIV
ncbi:MAG: polysaccharide pyruvyl transferase family protein [Lachnospiraceae bacterium]